MPLHAPVPASALLSLRQNTPSISVPGDFQSFFICTWSREDFTLRSFFLSFTLKLLQTWNEIRYLLDLKLLSWNLMVWPALGCTVSVGSNSMGKNSPTNACVCETVLLYWSRILSLQDMFFHATQRKHKIRGDTFIRNNLGLTPLTLAAKLGRKEMFHEILEYQSMVRNKCFHMTSRQPYQSFLCGLPVN